MHGVMGFGVLGLVFKLQKWDESALFFDGCSLGTLPLPIRILHNPVHIPPSDPIMAKLMNEWSTFLPLRLLRGPVLSCLLLRACIFPLHCSGEHIQHRSLHRGDHPSPADHRHPPGGHRYERGPDRGGKGAFGREHHYHGSLGFRAAHAGELPALCFVRASPRPSYRTGLVPYPRRLLRFYFCLCVWIVLNGVRRSQGGQEYAKRLEARELEKFAESEKGTKKTEGAKASNAKKDQ